MNIFSEMDNPLVSVVVVSYNASKSIVETLDSIKSQTYSPLELIIADDCSQDDTAIKCTDWLAINQDRFVRSKLIVNEENKGISANFNIGIRASTGEWIKILGDDILLPDAIEKNMTFATEKKCDMVVSRAKWFSDKTKEIIKVLPNDNYKFPVSSHEQFLAHIQNKLVAPSPTWFYKRDLYDRLGGINERYRLSDDIPFAFKLLESGEHFSYMPQVTVLYRITYTSVSVNRKSSGKQKQPFYISRSAVYYELHAPALKRHRLWRTLIHYNLEWYLYKKKIYSRDDSVARFFYGALFTILVLLRS